MKVFLFSVLVIFLASLSAQEKAEKASDLIESNEEELILEDDDQQIPSEKKDPESQKSHGVIENDEELILDDSEEYLIAPAAVAKPSSTSDSNDTSKNSSVASDSVTQDKKVIADSDSDQTETVNATLPKPQQVVVKAKDVKVENIKSINFAQNLKQYRSPKLAMLFSFLLPGSGQLYARHKLKASIFGAAELAIIGTGTALAVKGRKEMKRAQQFADANYSVDTFKTYYYDHFKPNVPDTIHNSIFGYGNLTVDQFLQMAQEKDNEFYKNIQGNDNPFVRGWKDVAPKFISGFTPYNPEEYKNYHPDTAYLVYYIKDRDSVDARSKARFGFSELQKEFESKFSKANNFYDISQKVFFLLLLDRIVSAVDAGITAKAYNDEMLGKQSFWQRINIEQKQVNSGWDTYSGYALVLRF